jgi:hypothetical protein
LADVEAQKKRDGALRSEEISLEAAMSGGTATEEQRRRLDEVKAERAAIGKLEAPSLIEQRLGNERSNLRRVETTLETNTSALDSLRRARNARGNDDILDALSVYGTFDGTAHGDKDGAGLAAGQVFSTGVAAQHLTRGLRDASILAQRVRCLEVVQAVAAKIEPAADRHAFLARSDDICRSGQEPQSPSS